MEDSQQLSCDTLPVAQRLSHTTRPSRFEPRSLAPQPEEGSTGRRDDSPVHGENRPHADNAHTPIRHSIPTSSVASAFFNQPPPRQLCVRHKRMADEGVSLKLQKASMVLSIVCHFGVPVAGALTYEYFSHSMLYPFLKEKLLAPYGPCSVLPPMPIGTSSFRACLQCAVQVNSHFSTNKYPSCSVLIHSSLSH